MRGFIAKWNAGEESRDELVSPRNADALESYRLAYKQCRAHLVGRSRFILTTTGNTRTAELLHNWYCDQKEWGIKQRGVIVFIDEAAKDLEVNVWAGIVSEQWSNGVKGVIMFGDDK